MDRVGVVRIEESEWRVGWKRIVRVAAIGTGAARVRFAPAWGRVRSEA